MHLYQRLYLHLFLILLILAITTATSKNDLQVRNNHVKIVAKVPVAPPDQPRIEFLNQHEAESDSNPNVLQFPYLNECAFLSPEQLIDVFRFIQDSSVDDILVIGNGGTEDRRAQKVEQIWKVFHALDPCLSSKSVENLATSIQQKKVFQNSPDLKDTLEHLSNSTR